VIATAAVFIVWFFKARRNIERLGASGGLPAGWAIGGWFIPCASLVLPVLVARDIWNGSSPRSRRISMAPLVVWWAAWVIGGIVQAVRTNIEPDDFTAVSDVGALIDDYTTARSLSVVAGIAWTVAAVFAIVVVRRVGTMQSERADEIRAEATASRLGAAE